MSGVLQKFCRRQSGNSPADDRDVAWRLGGGKSLLDHVEKLPVIGVLQAVKQRISEDPTDGDHHHHADQDQRNWSQAKHQDFRKVCSLFQIRSEGLKSEP